MSIPAGFLVERFGGKNRHDRGVPGGHGGIVEFRLAPGLSRGGVLAIRNGIGNGYAANRDQSPVAGFGGEAHFAFNSAFAQLVFGSASFLSPYMYSHLVLNLGNEHAGSNWLLKVLARLTPPALHGLPYTGFSVYLPWP